MIGLIMVGLFWMAIFILGLATDNDRLMDVGIIAANIYAAACLILFELR